MSLQRVCTDPLQEKKQKSNTFKFAANAKNPQLKARLEQRVEESNKVAKKMEIQKRKEAARKSKKTVSFSPAAMLKQKNAGR